MRLFIFLLTVCCQVQAHSFSSINSNNSRTYLAKIPENFNQRVVIVFHGANQQAESLLSNNYTNQFINLLLSSGFGVLLPNARADFGLVPFTSRWESENINNADIDFINALLDNYKVQYNRSISKSRIVDKVFLIGGSSGALMASRLALLRMDIAGIVLVNGANADQLSLMNGKATFNDNFSIPWYHCPLLNITSTTDEILPINEKLLYSDKLNSSLLSSEVYTTNGGTHNWDSWVVPYYRNIIGWLLR